MYWSFGTDNFNAMMGCLIITPLLVKCSPFLLCLYNILAGERIIPLPCIASCIRCCSILLLDRSETQRQKNIYNNWYKCNNENMEKILPYFAYFVFLSLSCFVNNNNNNNMSKNILTSKCCNSLTRASGMLNRICPFMKSLFLIYNNITHWF